MNKNQLLFELSTPYIVTYITGSPRLLGFTWTMFFFYLLHLLLVVLLLSLFLPFLLSLLLIESGSEYSGILAYELPVGRCSFARGCCMRHGYCH